MTDRPTLIRSFAALAPNRDSYGGVPTTPEAIATALAIEPLFRADVRVHPRSAGGVLFESADEHGVDVEADGSCILAQRPHFDTLMDDPAFRALYEAVRVAEASDVATERDEAVAALAAAHERIAALEAERHDAPPICPLLRSYCPLMHGVEIVRDPEVGRE